jgi:hypothetical protein
LPNIFISYRREDTGGQAGRLSDALVSHFGRANVFMDIDRIAPGSDFEVRIQQALAGCQLALILIGPRWLDAKDPTGSRRLDDPEDFVRKEVAAALARSGVTVIPILVENAQMPKPEQLPEEIRGLTKFNAFDLSNKRWQYDVSQLTSLVRRYDNLWWRVILRTPKLVLRGVPVAAVIIVAIVAVAVANQGRTPAQHIAACERSHDMSAQQVTRPPEPGESQFQESAVRSVNGEQLVFQQHSYASCSWPPGAAADADGYRAITVTLTNGPGQTDNSGRDFSDVIESHCSRIRLQYQEEFMGVQTPWTPFVARPGQIWAPAETRTATPRFVEVSAIGAASESSLDLPYYQPPGSIVVMHGQQALAHAVCLS